MSSRVELNEDLERQILNEPGVKDARRQLAQAIVDRAAVLVDRRTGAYSRSLRVVEDGDTIAAASDDFAAHIIEFGSVKTPAQAPLRRAARSLGVRVEDTPRP